MLTAAERLFNDNADYNSAMAKRRAKPKARGFIKIMRPEEVLKELEALGVSINIKTLQRYVNDGLVSRPETKAAGRGRGKIADYDKDTPAQFKASYYLLHPKEESFMGKLSKAEVKQAREIALDAINKTRETPNVGADWIIRIKVIDKLRQEKGGVDDLRPYSRLIDRIIHVSHFWKEFYTGRIK